jgi:hypothetical protein
LGSIQCAVTAMNGRRFGSDHMSVVRETLPTVVWKWYQQSINLPLNAHNKPQICS